MNPLQELKNLGQSIWLDFLSRDILTSGKLQQLIDEDGLCGVTSNPAIFKQAIADSQDYDDAIRSLVHEENTVDEIYESLTTEDIRRAADLFRPTYDRTGGQNGFVSLEVSPHLAYDTEGTIEEAYRLWDSVQRPNVLIKVPATREGIPAIHQLIREGINVNITLLFDLVRYQAVAEAYKSGLAEREKAGLPIEHIASVASFFLSRIDVLVDPQLEKIIEDNGPKADLAHQLHGQTAIASAKIAYQLYRELFDTEQFHKLERNGARRQRLLWASTSTKNPNYSDIKYVEALVGPETINTMPLETLSAYRDHGQPSLSLEKNVDMADQVLQRLPELGIKLNEVTQQLETEGVQKFIAPYNELMSVLAQRFKRYRLAEATRMSG